MNLRSLFTLAVKRRLLIASVIAATIVIHSPSQRLQVWNIDLPGVYFFRSILFFLSIGFLVSFIVKPVIHSIQKSDFSISYGIIAADSLKVFAIVALLVFPSTLGIMGVGYAQMSLAPLSFVDASDQLYQRMLMPAFAYALHLKGPMLYHFFSLAITFCTLFLLQIFFMQKKVILTTFEYVSIATSSFIITQFQSPGYTESLAYILILLLFVADLEELERAAVFALCIFAHEASVLILLAISIIFFSKRETGWIIAISAIYGFVWLASFGFHADRLLSVRTVGSVSTFSWIINYPVREMLGIIFSFKLLWIFIAVVLFKMRRERMPIMLLVLPGIALTLIAVDTSRMAGFSFTALIYSILYIKQNNLLSRKQFALVCSLNLCIPAVYVGVNSGIVYFDGLYQLLQFGTFLK
jgi:hypothetical protein